MPAGETPGGQKGGPALSDLLFSLYGISFRHPADWRFSMESRLATFQRGQIAGLSGTSRLALTVLWDRRDARPLAEVCASMTRGLKAAYKSSFRLLEERGARVDGHAALYFRVAFEEKDGLFRGREVLERAHLVCSCDHTDRLTVLYLTASAAASREERETIERILHSFICHP